MNELPLDPESLISDEKEMKIKELKNKIACILLKIEVNIKDKENALESARKMFEDLKKDITSIDTLEKLRDLYREKMANNCYI